MPLHLVCVGNDGRVWHTIRRPNGHWFAFGPVRDVVLASNPGSLDPGLIQDVACAGVQNDLQVCLLNRIGDVSHAIRPISGAPWTAFGNLLGAAGAPAGGAISLAAAQVNNQLCVCLALRVPPNSTQNTLYQTTRNAIGNWTPMKLLGGSFGDVACSSVGGLVHFCGTTFDRRGVSVDVLEHAAEDPATQPRRFTPFESVRQAVLGDNPGTIDPGTFGLVSCAGDGGSLHVCAISNGDIFHTIRRPDGSWFAFGPVKNSVVGDNPGSPIPGVLQGVGCAIVGGELHVVCIDVAGTIWHTIRLASGHWGFPFGDVANAVFGDNPGSPRPGPILRIDITDAF